MVNDDWSDIEVELIIADYFSMLGDEIKGVKINKSQHRKQLMPLLKNRTNGAIEFKHQNISAVLVDMGLPFIKGYLPRYHFQGSKLIEKVSEYIQQKPTLENLFADFANSAPLLAMPNNFQSLVVPAPAKKEKPEQLEMIRKPVNVNYLEREQNNKNLGLQGEELAIQYERYILSISGKESLSDKIEWVSKDVGDGLGYDILSKNINGTDKYI